MPSSEDGWILRIRHRLPAFWHFIVQRFKHGERYGLDLTLAFVAIALTLWAFVELVEGAITEADLQSLDIAIQTFVGGLLTPGLTAYVTFITDLGGTRGTIIGVVLVSVPLLFRRRWWSLFGLVFATGGGGLVVLGLKTFFARARPVETVIEAGGYAFPSGHAFSAMVFFGYLIFLGYRHFRSPVLHVLITVLSFTMIVLIGFSRVYLNVHWLTDVLGGFVAGVSWLVLSILIVRHVEWPHRSGSHLGADADDVIAGADS
jgi:undecaprenyl-diphosphatase